MSKTERTMTRLTLRLRRAWRAFRAPIEPQPQRTMMRWRPQKTWQMKHVSLADVRFGVATAQSHRRNSVIAMIAAQTGAPEKVCRRKFDRLVQRGEFPNIMFSKTDGKMLRREPNPNVNPKSPPPLNSEYVWKEVS